MTHRVLVGGFASGRRQMEKVAASLSAHYDEEVEAISFREAMDDPLRLERLTHQASVITHSAGMKAIEGTRPKELLAVAPPVPVWAPFLAARAIHSTAELVFRSCLPWTETDEVDGCVRDATWELSTHLKGNMRRLGRIAAFDAFSAALAAKEAGVETGMVLMRGDRLFQSHSDRIQSVRDGGVTVVEAPGAHEDFIKQPTRVVTTFEQGGVIRDTASKAPVVYVPLRLPITEEI